MPKIIKNGIEYAGASHAENVSYDNSTSGLSATDVQSAVDEVNSHAQNRAAASGGTAVSLVTTGDKYNWNNAVLKFGINSSNYATIWGVGSYSVLLVFGFAQGIGCVSLIVNISNNALSVVSMGTGTAWSSSNLTFSYNSTGKYVIIQSPQSSYSYLTVIKGGLTS